MTGFLLFAGPRHPRGGWNDLVGSFKDLPSAQAAAMQLGPLRDWRHVVDLQSGTIVYECEITASGEIGYSAELCGMPPEPDFSRMLHRYVLDDEGYPHRERNVDRWAEWMQNHSESLAETWPTPDVRVITRFLGTDQRRTKDGSPLLWETMIFGGQHDLHQERYTSQADALKGHERAVALANGASN